MTLVLFVFLGLITAAATALYVLRRWSRRRIHVTPNDAATHLEADLESLREAITALNALPSSEAHADRITKLTTAADALDGQLEALTEGWITPQEALDARNDLTRTAEGHLPGVLILTDHEGDSPS